jgi:hypothetical protein
MMIKLPRALAFGLWSCGLVGGLWALDPSVVPGVNFDLSAFKLQTLDSTDKQIEVQAGELSVFSSNLFFTDKTDGAMVFMVPSNGKTTQNTHYPRTELRQVGDGADWAIDDPATHYLHVQCKVIEVAKAKPQMIIGQIHGSNRDAEMIKLRWTGLNPGDCFIEARFQKNDDKKDEYGVLVAKNLSLGDLVDYTITMQNGTIAVTIKDTTGRQTYTKEFYSGDKYYFKAGNYLQYNGKNPIVIGSMKIYALSLIPPKK